MRADRGIIRGVMEAGANGYILKDDPAANEQLIEIIKSVAEGGVYLSQEAGALYEKHLATENGKQLSPRQLQALSLCSAHPGKKNIDLAKIMNVTHSTFRNFLSGAYIKLKAGNRTEAIAKAKQMGLITPDEK